MTPTHREVGFRRRLLWLGTEPGAQTAAAAGLPQAHIMNDEATRKFIQGLKRLMTFCQRRYPTDPSRSVDFDGTSNEGRGAVGGGSDKLALLEAVNRGEQVAPAPAPSMMEGNAVKIPPRWEHQIRAAMAAVAKTETGAE